VKAGLQNGGRDGWKPSRLGVEGCEEEGERVGCCGLTSVLRGAHEGGRPSRSPHCGGWGGGYLRDWVAMAL
jgi:hypothetical protein